MTNLEVIKKEVIKHIEELTPKEMARFIINNKPSSSLCSYCLDNPPECKHYHFCSAGITAFLEKEVDI